MNKAEFETLLRDISLGQNKACPPGFYWVSDKTPYDAWRTCPNGEWLLWIAEAMLGENNRLVLRAVYDCVTRDRSVATLDRREARMASWAVETKWVRCAVSCRDGTDDSLKCARIVRKRIPYATILRAAEKTLRRLDKEKVRDG